jgi:DNA replication protein DnaD
VEDLTSMRQSIKSEIEKTKEALLQSNDKRAIRFFLDSIHDDIRLMINEGFSYKQQLEIINKSTNKNIKYNTYLRYVKKYLNLAGSKRKELNESKMSREKGRDFGFTHEAVPDMEELY